MSIKPGPVSNIKELFHTDVVDPLRTELNNHIANGSIHVNPGELSAITKSVDDLSKAFAAYQVVMSNLASVLEGLL